MIPGWNGRTSRVDRNDEDVVGVLENDMLASEYFYLPGVPGLQSPPGVPAPPGFAARPFDPQTVRRDFPILQERVHGRPL
ncbi:hypothetical protein RZS08_07725, partial [Arthrospira platensis SPKY1]|nr:hypothetical protein [Arthrospira platensis SPKY1]